MFRGLRIGTICVILFSCTILHDLCLVSPLSCLSPPLHIRKPACLNGFQNRKTSWVFVLFSNRNKGSWAIVWNHCRCTVCIVLFFVIIVIQKYKGAALKIIKKTTPIITNIHPDCVMRMIKESIIIKVKVWIHGTPIASTIRVYAAWVSLSRATTVRTTPSLKPTLNLPSWLPSKNTEHKHIPKLIYSVSVKHIHSHTHSTAIILKEACKRSSRHTQSHTEIDGWMDKGTVRAHSTHNCTTL